MHCLLAPQGNNGEATVSAPWLSAEPMTDEETAKLEAVIRKAASLGVGADAADRLGDRIIYRDREGLDDRKSCVECRHVRSGPVGTNGRAAGLLVFGMRVSMGADFACQLQRCDGFMGPVG